MRMRRVSVRVHGGEGVAVVPVVVRVREGHHVLLADGHESVGEEVRVWKQNRTEIHTMNRLRFTAQLFPPPTSILSLPLPAENKG